MKSNQPKISKEACDPANIDPAVVGSARDALRTLHDEMEAKQGQMMELQAEMQKLQVESGRQAALLMGMPDPDAVMAEGVTDDNSDVLASIGPEDAGDEA